MSRLDLIAQILLSAIARVPPEENEDAEPCDEKPDAEEANADPS